MRMLGNILMVFLLNIVNLASMYTQKKFIHQIWLKAILVVRAL